MSEMSCVIYTRVSTSNQAIDGTSLDVQEEMCREKARELGYKDEQIISFREEGYSGEDIDIRPKMLEMRQYVANENVGHVICTHPDRFSRDMTDKLIVCRELEKNDANLAFTDTEFENSPEGILFFNIISAIASYELALIKKRTIRGRIDAVKKANKIMPMRVAPFGYELVNNKLIVNKDESEIVKMIYEWYVHDRLTLRQIGEKLYTMGVSPKRKESKNWSASSISRILKSEIYIGKYYYNKRKTKKERGQTTKSGKPKRTYQIRDKKDWIEVNVPPIIEKSLFEMAQERRLKNKTQTSNNVKYQYLLKSKLRCGHCGRVWSCTTYNGRVDKKTGKKKKYTCYRCPNKNPRKYGSEIKKCNTQTIRTELLDNYIWDEIVETLDPKMIKKALEKPNDDKNESIIKTIDLLTKQRDQKIKEKERIKKMYVHEVIEEDEMLNDISKVNKEIAKIDIEIQSYEQNLSSSQKANLNIKNILETAEYVKNIVQNGDNVDFDLKRNIVDLLIDEIFITDSGDKISIKCFGTLENLRKEKVSSDVVLSSYRQDNVNLNQCTNFLIESMFDLKYVKVHNNSYEKKVDKHSKKTNLMIR